MTSEFIINVNENTFEPEVLAYSQNVPVLVDFWAEWSAPCKILDPLLEQVTKEGQGSFRLARVDVDANKNLTIRYGIRSVPVVKAFLKGQVVAEFSGLQPEIKVREFIRTISPNPADLLVEKGSSYIREKDWQKAESAYREALSMDPGLPVGLLGLSRCLLARGEGIESLAILKRFPASHEYKNAENLLPLAQIFAGQLEAMTIPTDDPLEAAFWNSMRLARRGNFQAALDGLLDIMRKNKGYKDGMARQIILSIFQVMGDEDPDTREYRSELASILF